MANGSERCRYETVRPPHRDQRGGALLLGSVTLIELGEAQTLLELHLVARHVAPRSGIESPCSRRLWRDRGVGGVIKSRRQCRTAIGRQHFWLRNFLGRGCERGPQSLEDKAQPIVLLDQLLPNFVCAFGTTV